MKKIITQSYHKSTDRVDENYSAVIRSTVEEILYQAEVRSVGPIANFRCLDVGSGLGEYAFELERKVLEVVGVEPYKPVFLNAVLKKRQIKSRVKFFNETIEDFYSKNKFDLVISLTTIEHMPNAEKSFRQIFSLMKKGGLLYLTAPNKWWPYEHHYKLFFLSWLPQFLANFYVRSFQRGSSYQDSAYSKSYFGMRRFLDKFPCVYEFVLPRSSESYFLGCGHKGKFYSFIKRFGIELIRIFPFFWIFSKGFIIIAKKTDY